MNKAIPEPKVQSEVRNTDSYSQIIGSLVRTKFEANLLLAEIDTLERSLYKIGEGDYESALEKGVRAKTAYAVRAAVSSENKEEFLKNLRQRLNALTYLEVTIAFEPTLETVNRIYIWAKQNLGEGVALDITVNKSILGGAIIEYKGKVATNTLVAKVDEYFIAINI